jgi:TolB-like protein
LFLFSAFLLVVSGCGSNPGATIKNLNFTESLSLNSWKKIAVLPFSGDKKFQRTSAEWLSFHLQKQPHYSIVTPTFAEIEIKNHGMDVTGNEFSIEQAQQAGRILKVDAVLLGNIETAKISKSPVKISLQLIDVKTGEMIATHTIGYPSWVLLWDNFQEYVKLATDTAGRDFIKVLKYLAEGKQVNSFPKNTLSSNNNDLNEI